MNFNKYICIFIILIIITIITNSCNKEIYYSLDSDTKEFCVFNEKSYWIYQDSATKIIDSVELIKCQKKFQNTGREYFENYKLEFQHKIKDSNIFLSAEIKTVVNKKTVKNIYNANLLYINEKELNFFKKDLFSMFCYFNKSKFFVGELFYDINVNNKRYDEVLVNTINNSETGEAEIKIYWVANLGIIRYEIKNNIFNLIDYNITQ